MLGLIGCVRDETGNWIDEPWIDPVNECSCTIQVTCLGGVYVVKSVEIGVKMDGCEAGGENGASFVGFLFGMDVGMDVGADVGADV
jgi:hypothetical protein